MSASQNLLIRQQFTLTDVEDLDTEIGVGSYAQVIELRFRGLKCAGKKLHRQLYNSSPKEQEGLLQRFEAECELLSELRHPNIVQFLGVYYGKNCTIPILVMEYLEMTLTDCVARYGILPDEISYPILEDVGTALCYLNYHTPPIIHRDMTANNVLLSSDMKAKVSDLGMAKVLGLDFLQRAQMTTCPGAQSYMPPEALSHNPTYGTSIDLFSMGVLMLHVFSGDWPIPSEANRIDPCDPNSLVPLTEVERRQKFFDLVSKDHPLMMLMKKCLSNYHVHRPDSYTITGAIHHVHKGLHTSFENKVQMLKQHQSYGKSKKTDEKLQFQIADLQAERDALKRIMKTKEDLILAKEKEISDKVEAKENEIEAKDQELSAKNAEISSYKTLLASKEEIISGLYELQEGLPFQFHFRNCANFPFSGASGNPHCVVIDSMLYAGGGFSHSNAEGRSVFCYNKDVDKWNSLPPCPQTSYGLGNLSGKLVAVGGVSMDGRHLLADACIFDSKVGKWKASIPPMPTARLRPTVVSHKSSVAVCGGVDHSNSVSDKVEVYQTGNRSWHTAAPLAIGSCLAKPVVIGNLCYLVGGYDHWRDPIPTRKVQYASLSDMFGTAQEYQVSSSGHKTWDVLSTDMPNDRSVGINVSGALVVIGGWRDSACDEMYTYCQSSQTWVRVGTWPWAFRGGGAAEFKGGETMIVGGIVENNKSIDLVTMVSLTSK